MSEENDTNPGDSSEWAASLPAELKEAAFLRADADGNYKPLSQVVSDLNDAAQHMGNSLRIPGPDAGESDMTTFQQKVMEKIPGLMATPNLEDADSLSQTFAKLGKPDSADSYKVPEGVDIEGEALGQLKSIAHKSNLTQSQFQEYLTNWTAANGETVQQAQLKHEEAMATLKGEWGASFDENIGQIAALLKTNQTTPPYVIEQLEQGNLPADQVRWLHSLADAVSNEDGQFHQQGNDPAPAMLNPTEARLRADEVVKRMYDRDNPPTTAEMEILDKKQTAYEHMARGRKPPAELMQYIQ